MKQIFPGVFSRGKTLLTQNFSPGRKVYGEELVHFEGKELRVWNAFRSKLGAAISNGLKELPLSGGSKVLYLGIAEGTTASHMSDIMGEKGVIFGVDVAERTMRKLIEICDFRPNIIPILADANRPESYAEYLKGHKIDLLYQDIAQKNQAEIFNRNARMFLRRGSKGLLVIKARSISQKEKADAIFGKETGLLEKEFKILQTVNLRPFDKEHAIVLCEKK